MAIPRVPTPGDNAATRNLVRTARTMEGYQVDEAADGAAAKEGAVV